jgi:hypothetical protein
MTPTLMGEVSRELSDMAWRARSEHVWPAITAALDALCAENDVVVIEGTVVRPVLAYGTPDASYTSTAQVVNDVVETTDAVNAVRKRS